VDGIFWLIFYITTVWFFITEGLIVYFIIRYRRRPGRKAVYAAGDSWSARLGSRTLAVVVVLDLIIDIRGADVGQSQLQRPAADVIVRAVGNNSTGSSFIPARTESSTLTMI
jgi:heme/copper-type cytochrome/quinol oxidase subunit 2